MKSAIVGVKHANAAIEFKRINLDFDGFNSQIGYPENLFAFQIPFLEENIVMFTFEDNENKYSEYNALGYNTPIIFLSKKGHFVDLNEYDKQQITTILNTLNVKDIYKEDKTHENQK